MLFFRGVRQGRPSLSNLYIFGGCSDFSLCPAKLCLARLYFWGVPLTVQTLVLVRNVGGLIESFFTKDHEYK